MKSLEKSPEKPTSLDMEQTMLSEEDPVPVPVRVAKCSCIGSYAASQVEQKKTPSLGGETVLSSSYSPPAGTTLSVEIPSKARKRSREIAQKGEKDEDLIDMVESAAEKPTPSAAPPAFTRTY